jgi:hypothetical protein
MPYLARFVGIFWLKVQNPLKIVQKVLKIVHNPIKKVHKPLKIVHNPIKKVQNSIQLKICGPKNPDSEWNQGFF